MTFEEYADMMGWRTVAERAKAEDLHIAYMYGVRYGVRDASKRIKLLEQRVIDLQGHSDLSYLDKKLSEQESE